MDIHGDFRLRGAIGEEKRVLIRGSDGVRVVKRGSRWRREVPESEQKGYEFGVEDAERLALLEFEEKLDDRFFGEEKESKARWVGGGERGDDGDG